MAQDGFWNDVDTLARWSRVVPYFLLSFGFLVALGGQLLRSKLEARIKTLQDAAEEQRRRTPPQVDAYLATSKETADLRVVIDAANFIPFRANWRIVTEKDRIVSGIMLSDVEIHPQKDRPRFSAKADVDKAQVSNHFIELRLRYESIYASQLGNPPELSGQIVRRYWIDDIGVRPLDASERHAP